MTNDYTPESAIIGRGQDLIDDDGGFPIPWADAPSNENPGRWDEPMRPAAYDPADSIDGEAEDDGPRTFSLDTVADLIRRAGFSATVEQTGGGCATLYAGRRGEDEYGNETADVIVGPGWFTSGGFGGRGAGATFDPSARCAPFAGAMADDVECALAGRNGDVVLYAEDVRRGASIPHALASVAISILDPTTAALRPLAEYHG